MTSSVITRMPPPVRLVDERARSRRACRSSDGCSRSPRCRSRRLAAATGRTAAARAGDAEALQVVELLRQAREVADAVVVAVEERADVRLVDDGVLVPERIRRFGHARVSSPLRVRAAAPRPAVQAGCAPRGPRDRAGRSSTRRASDTARPDSRSCDMRPSLSRRQPPRRERQLDEAVLHVERIEVDDDEHQVACRRPNACCSRAAPGCRSDGTQAPVALQRRMVAPDRVDRAISSARLSGRVAVRGPDLVFLRVEVLLAAWPAPARSRTARSRCRCRSSRRASPRAPAAPGTPAGRRAAGTRAGCPACSRRGSAAGTRGRRSGSAR